LPNPNLQDVAAIATTVSAYFALVSAVAAIASAVAAFISLVILTVAAIFAGGQLRSAEKSRQLSVLQDLSDKWSSQLIREARLLVERGTDAELRAAHKDERYYKILALANFFEDMGLLEKDGQLTLAQVADRFKPSVLHYEEKLLTSFFAGERDEDPAILSNFAMLANKLRVS
jgi:hypothetical protein